jgi:hypothetical protein
MAYTNLRDAKNEIKIKDGQSIATEDAWIMQALRWVTDRIERWPSIGFDFAPRVATRYYDAQIPYSGSGGGLSVFDSEQQDNRILLLNDPILEVTELTDGNGDELVEWDGVRATRADSDFYLFERGKSPWWKIRLLPESGASWADYDTDPVEAIEIVGVWGYRSGYDRGEGWLSSGDETESNPLTISGTSLTVNDADGSDGRGVSPRFSAGMWLRIGTASTFEIVEVLSVDEDTNTLSILRGQRGTTAVQWVQNSPISIWEPEPSIVRAASTWVAYLYGRRGEFASGEISPSGFTVIKFPPDAPPEAAAILDSFAGDSPGLDSEGWAAV